MIEIPNWLAAVLVTAAILRSSLSGSVRDRLLDRVSRRDPESDGEA